MAHNVGQGYVKCFVYVNYGTLLTLKNMLGVYLQKPALLPHSLSLQRRFPTVLLLFTIDIVE